MAGNPAAWCRVWTGAVLTALVVSLYTGAALFYVSDILAASRLFITPGPEITLFGIPLYYAARVLLADSGARKFLHCK